MPNDEAEHIPVNKGGRPLATLDLEMIERAASIGCRVEEIAALQGVAPSTIYARMANDPEFSALMERGRDKGKASLRRLQWQAATDGNTSMLIWLGKQMLGQKDQAVIGGDPNAPLHAIMEIVLVNPT